MDIRKSRSLKVVQGLLELPIQSTSQGSIAALDAGTEAVNLSLLMPDRKSTCGFQVSELSSQPRFDQVTHPCTV